MAPLKSNDGYAWGGHYNVDRVSAANGLNQLLATTPGGGQVSVATLGYDARGNLTTSGAGSYGYTSENRLASAPGGVSLRYDPLGRLVIGNALQPGERRYDYDGFALTAEYDGGNNLPRRYVHGPGIDQPIVWYEGTGLSDKRFLTADERGSIVAVSDASGAAIAINKYDEYGIPAATNLGRFQYTGQTWLPEIGMYYYKARIYSPTLGRFLQTDPIGYGDGMNWYNYVGSDPVNFADPSGLSDEIVVTGPNLRDYDDEETIVVTAPRITRAIDDSYPEIVVTGTGRFAGGGGGGGGHTYTVDVNVSCPADQTFDAYLDARTAPGAGRPSPGQIERNVELFGGNWIRQTIDYTNRTVLNETIRGRHAFHPGAVFIRITPIDGGSNISIVGTGTGGSEHLNRAAFEGFFRGGAVAEKIRCVFAGGGR